MIVKDIVIQTVTRFLADTGYYLVDVNVSNDNVIKVEIDSSDRVSIDFCAELSRKIEAVFDRDIEDYDLEVSSAGLTEPFKVHRQYEKYLGKSVETLLKDGKKIKGLLTSVNDDDFEIEYKEREKAEGAKRKTVIVRHLTLKYNEIKYTKYNLIF